MLIFAEMMQSFLLPPHPRTRGVARGGHGGMSPHLSSEERGKRRKREGKGGMFPPFEFRRGKEGKGKRGDRKGEKRGEERRKIINY